MQLLPPHSENSIHLNPFEDAIKHILTHNYKRCRRYWLARSRENRDMILKPLVGLAFKTAGGKINSAELTKILVTQLEGMRP